MCGLLLLVLSLATVSVLAYREAQFSLEERKSNSVELLQAKYAARKQAGAAKFDEALLNDAKLIASSVALKAVYPDKRFQGLASLAALGAPLTPYGGLTIHFPLNQGVNPFLRDKVEKGNAVLKFQDIRTPPDEEANHTRYYQANVAGDQWRSPSLEDLVLPFDPEQFTGKHATPQTPLVDWTYADLELQSNKKVRVVRTKFSRFGIDYWSGFYTWPKKDPKAKAPAPGSKDKPAAVFPAPPPVSIYIQVAGDTEPLEQTLIHYKAQLDQELDALEDGSQQSLEDLRNRLLLLGSLTLLAAAVGTCVVVNWGLAPLGRLSDAVSKVSERDFHLPMDMKPLPSELQPIAYRLEQTLDQLKRAFGREKQAAADISHELRTPLAAMLTTIDVALRKPRRAEEYHDILEECRGAAIQISQLVERMLALARLDAGVDHLRPSEVDVARLADQCSSLVRPLAEARGVSVHVAHNGPACIHADPDKLREVLTNLLHNAIEYNKPDGRIEVSVHRENGTLEMEVRDTGIGISPQAQEHIFERFYREDPSRHAEGLHAGIGLALVKGYVDLMGGQIRVDSIVGEGSTFTIRLPAREEGNP